MSQSTGSPIKNGYTLLEALFHLIIFVLFSHLLIFIFTWIQKQNETYINNESGDWEIFVNDFQNYLLNVEEIKVVGYDDKIDISYIHSNETIQISQLNTVIRKQVRQVGHVPMLMGIRNLKFELRENVLKLIVQFPSGVVRERSFIVQIHSE